MKFSREQNLKCANKTLPFNLIDDWKVNKHERVRVRLAATGEHPCCSPPPSLYQEGCPAHATGVLNLLRCWSLSTRRWTWNILEKHEFPTSFPRPGPRCAAPLEAGRSWRAGVVVAAVRSAGTVIVLMSGNRQLLLPSDNTLTHIHILLLFYAQTRGTPVSIAQQVSEGPPKANLQNELQGPDLSNWTALWWKS